jgi:hypothetical protein
MTRVLQWATVMVVALTLASEIHGYWFPNPTATCLSAHGDTYQQVRACTVVITLADIEGKPDATYHVIRGEAEETNCDLHDAALDYRRAVELAPRSPRADQLAMAGVEVEGEYCSRGENAERATAILLYGALVAFPYALAGLAFICGLFWLASRHFLAALLLTLSSVSWLVALLDIYLAAMTFYGPGFADFIPEWLVQEILFWMRFIMPLWCVLIASWLTFWGFRTWPRAWRQVKRDRVLPMKDGST